MNALGEEARRVSILRKFRVVLGFFIMTFSRFDTAKLASFGHSRGFPQMPRSLLRGGFTIALILSGITAFPLQRELAAVTSVRGFDRAAAATDAGNSFDRWILTVRDGLQDSYTRYPWLAYGTDWLAFAHIVIAVFFFGPLKDPVKNIWVLQAGLIACALVIPLALVCGQIREIPYGWRLIDCSFGVIGAIPLYYCLRLAREIENMSSS